jgi:hypothetical protein
VESALHQIRKQLLSDGPNYHIGLEKGLWLLDSFEAALTRIAELEAQLKEKKNKETKL